MTAGHRLAPSVGARRGLGCLFEVFQLLYPARALRRNSSGRCRLTTYGVCSVEFSLFRVRDGRCIEWKDGFYRDGAESSSCAKSGVSERREKTATEAWSDGGDCDAEEVRKEPPPPTAPRKKGVQSEKKIQTVEDVDAEIAHLKAPPRILT